MDARYYRDLIVRAVLGTNPAMIAQVADGPTLDAIAGQLAQAEDAVSVLRAKGYGVHGMNVSATARQVPEAPMRNEIHDIWSSR
jgi:hypothetical protein